ncbi:MAG TPA: hypothetical protein VIW45_07745 [Vicinamibacterales bacterium]
MEIHDRPAFPWWLAVVMMLALAAGVGLFTYNVGLAHGIAQSGAIAAAPAAPGAAPPAPYVYYYPRHWGWGFGFFPFFGLLWFFLIFGLIRRLMWGPRWWWRRRYYGYYGCGPWGYDDYWHRGPYGQGPQGPQGQPGPPPPTTTQL